MKNILAVCFVMLACTSISACNTVEGFGRDIEQAGEKIQDL